MKRTLMKCFAALLCLVMICSCVGFTMPDDHDHDHEQSALTMSRHSLLACLIPAAARAETERRLVNVDAGSVPLAARFDEGQAPAPEATPCPHNGGWTGGADPAGYDCILGQTWVYYETCNLCGFKQYVAYRPSGAPEQGSNKHSTHQGLTTEYVQDPTCPNNQVAVERCSVCGYSRQIGTYGHQWGDWTKDTKDCTAPQYRVCAKCGQRETKPGVGVHSWGPVVWEGSCTSWTKTRTCNTCGAKEVVSSGSGHEWEEIREEATCTTAGKWYQKCKHCGTIGQTEVIPAHHSPGVDDGNCTTPVRCIKCNAVVTPAKSHKLVWASDSSGHWQRCTNAGCNHTTSRSAHTIVAVAGDCTASSKCSVCGYKTGQAAYTEHDFSRYVIASTEYHTRHCTHPGCEQVSAREPHTPVNDTPDRPCTEDVVCACGYPIRRGNNAHSWGPWVATPSGHTRTCTKCGATETGNHKSSGKTGDCTNAIVCTVCGYVIESAYGGHAWGVWMPNSSGTGHYQICTHAGCSAMRSAAHSGGRATCTSRAVCSQCGASYGSKSSTNHSGGTEVRNYRAPQIGVAGYTGDTYCLGCGAVIKRGVSIAMLAKDHTHEYGGWRSDSSHHWKECACGERSGYTTHSFSAGKCTVCGASDPNYKVCSGSLHVGGTEVKNAKPAKVGEDGYTGDVYCTACHELISSGNAIPALSDDHVHKFSGGWKSDSASHWHECSCGEHSGEAAHVFRNGRCALCGAKDPSVEDGEEAHVHVYGELKSNGMDHWRECTICGEQAERGRHTLVDGQCLTCGYTKPVAENLTDVAADSAAFAAIKRVMEAGILGAENNAFRPEEKVQRSVLADILYRLAGNPVAVTDEAYAGLDEETAHAMTWVSENSLLAGDGLDQSVTVQELVTLLWRYAQLMDGQNADAENADELAAAWAAESGLMSGYGEAAPDMAGEATRADAAVIVAQFMNARNLMVEEEVTVEAAA